MAAQPKGEVPSEDVGDRDDTGPLDDLVRLARPADLAPDFAEQFAYYTKGAPWRQNLDRSEQMVLKGHFNGETFVSDEPLPEGLSPNKAVEIHIVDEAEEDVFDQIARMAIKGGFPPDYAEQHDHYVKGTPRK